MVVKQAFSWIYKKKHTQQIFSQQTQLKMYHTDKIAQQSCFSVYYRPIMRGVWNKHSKLNHFALIQMWTSVQITKGTPPIDLWLSVRDPRRLVVYEATVLISALNFLQFI